LPLLDGLGRIRNHDLVSHKARLMSRGGSFPREQWISGTGPQIFFKLELGLSLSVIEIILYQGSVVLLIESTSQGHVLSCLVLSSLELLVRGGGRIGRNRAVA